ncbi:hypothetical protein CK203_019402 [Vitis vinifera]|uniref:C2 domain-containing protein n=1 Tax=Vitis vinifera TaxID=29760 RepID=A0A438IYQ1_VITVI|nr:hypothetical protein CK203_019402 [Vitis vinifera]
MEFHSPAIPEQREKTPVDKKGKTDPAWNFTTGFTIGNEAIEYQGVMLVIKLYCSRTLGDRYVGEVRVSFKDLFDGAAPHQPRPQMRYCELPSDERYLAVAGIVIVRVVLEVALGTSLSLEIPFFGEDVPIELCESEGSSSLPSFFPFSIPVGSPGKTIPPLSQQKASPASCQNVPLKSEKIWTAAKMSTSRWSSRVRKYGA